MFGEIFPSFNSLKKKAPVSATSFIGKDWFETYIINENTVGVRCKWIYKKENPPPKDKAFLALTEGGVQQAFWSHNNYVGSCHCCCCRTGGCTVVYFDWWLPIPEWRGDAK